MEYIKDIIFYIVLIIAIYYAVKYDSLKYELERIKLSLKYANKRIEHKQKIIDAIEVE